MANVPGRRGGVTIPSVQGLPGPPGPPGPATATAAFPFAASASVVIAHNLGRIPAVTVTTVGGLTVCVSVTHLDSNRVYLDFSAPMAGVAYFT